jgi:hypothetical protein
MLTTLHKMLAQAYGKVRECCILLHRLCILRVLQKVS